MFLSLIHQREFFIDVERSAAESSGQHQSRALISRVLSTAEQSGKQSRAEQSVRSVEKCVIYTIALCNQFFLFQQWLIVQEDDSGVCLR